MELLKNKKQSFFVLFFIQRNKVKSDGRVPIMARITVNGEKTHFSTKFDVLPERWTVQDHRTVGATKEERDINDTLEELRSMIKRRYYEFVSNGQAISAIILKNSIFSVESRCTTLLPLCKKFIKEYYPLTLNGSVTMDTYQRYVYTRRRLTEYMIARYNLHDISIFDVNHDFIKGFDLWLRIDCGIGNNSAAKLVKHFRTMFNVALNNGWMHSDPFSNYKIQFEKADRGYLTQEELTKLM